MEQKTKLQQQRLKKRLSQSGLSGASGIKLRTLQHYEQRTRPIDSSHLETLCDLANALDCRIEDILESEELIKKYRKVK